jgi:UDP-glucose 4-epimerase
MTNNNKRILVTGGAGFIGSRLTTQFLLRNTEVVAFDNLSSGSKANLREALNNPHFRLVEGDLLDFRATRSVLGDCSFVCHLAADPEVRLGGQNPDSHFKQNLQATYNLLEAIRIRNIPTRLVFASTSTVYGEASAIPTPENYGPLLPISTYGATKLGCEALSAAYTQLCPLQVIIFRFANVVGSRSGHGVIFDFIEKLLINPNELEVLGDGTQSKSYLHISDCIDAFLLTLDDKLWGKTAEPYNIGTEQQTNVLTIARVVGEAMGLQNVETRTTAGADGRAWPGDVKTMQLDIGKMKQHSWEPKLTSEEAVRRASEELVRELPTRTKNQ